MGDMKARDIVDLRQKILNEEEVSTDELNEALLAIRKTRKSEPEKKEKKPKAKSKRIEIETLEL